MRGFDSSLHVFGVRRTRSIRRPVRDTQPSPDAVESGSSVYEGSFLPEPLVEPDVQQRARRSKAKDRVSAQDYSGIDARFSTLGRIGRERKGMNRPDLTHWWAQVGAEF